MAKLVVIIERTENGFSAYCPELLGCVAADETIEGVKQQMKDVIDFHLEGMLEEGEEIPESLKGKFKIDFVFDVKKLLKNLKGTITQKALSNYTGVNKALLSHYASGIKQPREKQALKIFKGLQKLSEDLLNYKLQFS